MTYLHSDQGEKTMAYWRLFYHFIWTTKNREPLLTPDLELHVHRYSMSKGGELGALIFALDGVEDHLHVVAAVPPRLSPARGETARCDPALCLWAGAH